MLNPYAPQHLLIYINNIMEDDLLIKQTMQSHNFIIEMTM